MFEHDHRLHYAARAEHATELGRSAVNPKIAALHYELALRFWILAERGDDRNGRLASSSDENEAAHSRAMFNSILIRDQSVGAVGAGTPGEVDGTVG